MNNRLKLMLATVVFTSTALARPFIDYLDPMPFGDDTGWAREAENASTGEWWLKEFEDDSSWDEFTAGHDFRASEWFKSIDRSEAMAFALYAHDRGVLKISAQCFPLLPEEPKFVTLEFWEDGEWVRFHDAPVLYPGWSAHFRVEGWDNTKDVRYRVRLGDLSSFEGLIRKDPIDKDTIVVAALNCNSSRDPEVYTRTQIVKNLKYHDPDLLFFAGDQQYTHDEATYGWLLFGVQFRDVLRDRPTICILDDHDVGHGNLWGEGGKVSDGSGGAADGGYMFPASFVRMAERQQTWHLPDAYDPTPILQGIGVYYTELVLGGISFAILEDRKFKSAPLGRIPVMGPRPDHITDPDFDREAVDLPGLEMLGERQMKFLDAWARDWTDAEMKVVLSQTPFAGSVHIHGNLNNRLVGDLDSNAWPQTPRNEALRAIRRAHAPHIAGDQHLAVVLQHGIDEYRDGPFSFTAPAIVNTIYGRWWHPEDEQPGGGEPIGGPLPWVGDYKDGFHNRITMHAYANPPTANRNARKERADGYGIVRLHKPTGQTIFEAWPRFSDVREGDSAQYPGWPIVFNASENDGRTPVGHLEEVTLPVENAVVELTNEATGELIYSIRVRGTTFAAPVYSLDKHTLKAGANRGDTVLLSGAVGR